MKKTPTKEVDKTPQKGGEDKNGKNSKRKADSIRQEDTSPNPNDKKKAKAVGDTETDEKGKEEKDDGKKEEEVQRSPKKEEGKPKRSLKLLSGRVDTSFVDTDDGIIFRDKAISKIQLVPREKWFISSDFISSGNQRKIYNGIMSHLCGSAKKTIDSFFEVEYTGNGYAITCPYILSHALKEIFGNWQFNQTALDFKIAAKETKTKEETPSSPLKIIVFIKNKSRKSSILAFKALHHYISYQTVDNTRIIFNFSKLPDELVDACYTYDPERAKHPRYKKYLFCFNDLSKVCKCGAHGHSRRHCTDYMKDTTAIHGPNLRCKEQKLPLFSLEYQNHSPVIIVKVRPNKSYPERKERTIALMSSRYARCELGKKAKKAESKLYSDFKDKESDGTSFCLQKLDLFSNLDGKIILEEEAFNKFTLSFPHSQKPERLEAEIAASLLEDLVGKLPKFEDHKREAKEATELDMDTSSDLRGHQSKEDGVTEDTSPSSKSSPTAEENPTKTMSPPHTVRRNLACSVWLPTNLPKDVFCWEPKGEKIEASDFMSRLFIELSGLHVASEVSSLPMLSTK